MKFEHQVKSFQELSLEEFHDIIALRIQIFIIEQNCPYQEVDGKDKLAHHLFFKNEMGKGTKKDLSGKRRLSIMQNFQRTVSH